MDRRNLLQGLAAATAAGGATLFAQRAVAQSNQPGSESTFERIKRTKVLRIGALAGEEPYFRKDLATGAWSGACMAMANDIAAKFGAKVEPLETTYANSVADLQTGKIDLAFALNPTPERAMSIDFTSPVWVHSFTVIGKKGPAPVANWDDINKPNVKIAVDAGTTHEVVARRYLPKAVISAFKTRDQAFLAIASGRADYVVVLTMLAINAIKKNPQLGQMSIPKPLLTMPVSMGVRTELADRRWCNWLSIWAEYNRSMGNIRSWLVESLTQAGVTTLPPEIQF